MNKQNLKDTIKLFLIILLVSFSLIILQTYGLENIRDKVHHAGAWGPILIIFLRFISIIIPALPSTAYSLIAGGLFGFKIGILIICIADIFSCMLSFTIAKIYGEVVVRKFIGKRLMHRLDRVSSIYIQENFFLMTGILMTGFFDFFCYGLGLTKTSYRKFFPAMIASILISNPPIVALGAGILEGGKTILIIAILGILILSIISNSIQARLKQKV